MQPRVRLAGGRNHDGRDLVGQQGDRVVRVLGRPIHLAQQAALFLDLQRPFAGGEPVRPTADHHQGALVLQCVRDLRDVQVFFLQELGGSVRQLPDGVAERVGLVGAERTGRHTDLQRQQIEQHEPGRQHRHVRAAPLAGRETDTFVAQLLEDAALGVGHRDGQHAEVGRMSGGVERLDAGTGCRLQDDRGRLVPLGPVVGELQGLVTLGGPSGPLPTEKRPELRTVKRRAASGEDEVSNALLDETMGQRRQLGTQLEHVAHQVGLTPHVLDQEIGMMLANVVGPANAGPQRHPRELGLQPGGHRILGCRRGCFRIPCEQLAGPRRQLVRHRFVSVWRA